LSFGVVASSFDRAMRAKVTRALIFVFVVIFSAGCPRSPEQPPWPESERNPGLMPKPAGRILWEREIASADETVADSVTSAQGAALTDPSVLEAQYSAAADEGQVWAQTRLGVLYARAENDPERWQKAVRLLQLAAGQGDGEAQYELAGMAAAGRGMPASDVEAFGYMKEAAARGLADAQYQLASMYAGGRGTAVDKAAAAEWGRRAAAQNHIPAQFSLGCLLVESDDDAMKSEGVNWLKRAATAGSRKAAMFLAAALARGDFKVAKNEGEAELLIKPLADNGDAEAQFILAWLYMFGEKFADRRPLAREYLEMAAKAGHENAAAALKGLPAAP
jgi:TPR repeat protein